MATKRTIGSNRGVWCSLSSHLLSQRKRLSAIEMNCLCSLHARTFEFHPEQVADSVNSENHGGNLVGLVFRWVRQQIIETANLQWLKTSASTRSTETSRVIFCHTSSNCRRMQEVVGFFLSLCHLSGSQRKLIPSSLCNCQNVPK